MNTRKESESIRSKPIIKYRASLAPSKELMEAIEKQQYSAEGYDPHRNLQFSTPYNGTESLSDLGCKMYFIRKLDALDEDIALVRIAEMAKGQNYYLFNESTKQLFYSKNNSLVNVTIEDQAKFLDFLNAMCDGYEYKFKFLSFAEIKQLITDNGGHEPAKPTCFPKAESTSTKSTQLMRDLFPSGEEIEEKKFASNLREYTKGPAP